MLRPRWLVSCAAFSVLVTLCAPGVPQVATASVSGSAVASVAPDPSAAAARPAFDVAPLVTPVAKPRLAAITATVRGFDARYSQLVDAETTPTSEFFRNADGSGTALISSVPVRFKGDDGAWHGIDPTLVTDVDGSLRPRSVQTLSRIQLDQGEPAVTVSTPAGDIEVRHTGLAADLVRPLLPHRPNGVAAGTIAALAKVVDSQASVAVTGGAQVHYDMGAHGFTDDIELSSASDGAVYRVTMRLPKGAQASQSGRGIEISDSAGNQLATYTGGVAYDAVAAAASPDGMGAPDGTTTPVAISLLSHGAGVAVVSVSIDAVWLGDPKRVFPVVIDPYFDTTTGKAKSVTGTDDTYVTSDNQNSTVVSGGPNQGQYYYALHFLREGNETGAGTARPMIPFYDVWSYNPPTGWSWTVSSTAQLHLYSTAFASCNLPTDVNVIEKSWDPHAITWSSVMQLNAQNDFLSAVAPDGTQNTYTDATRYTSSPSTAVYAWTTFDVTNAIGSKYTGSFGWYGLELQPNPEHWYTADCAYDWASADWNHPDYTPYLTINFTPTSSTSPPAIGYQDVGNQWSQPPLKDPVNVVTGGLKDSFTDIAPAGVYGLDWTRTYNLYDAKQNLSTGGLGRGWSSSYFATVAATNDGTGDVKMTGPDGRQVTWTPNSSGGFSRPFQYAADLSIVNGDYRVTFNDTSYWDFDGQGRLAAMTSSNGQQRAVVLWNTSDHLVSVTTSTTASTPITLGVLNFQYGANGQISSVSLSKDSTSPGFESVSYGYDTAGNLHTFTDIAGNVTTFGYDSSNFLASMTDPTGVVQMANTFTSSGQVATQKQPSGATTTFAYGTVDSSTWTTTVQSSVTGSAGKATYYWQAPNNNKQVVQIEDNLPNPSGGTGNSATEAFGNSGNDTLGDLVNATSRLGGQNSLTYDGANRVTCDAQPGGQCPAAGAALSSGSGPYTAYQYDAFGRIVDKFINGEGDYVYTYKLDTDRLPSSMKDPTGATTAYVVVNNLVMSQTDADNVVTSFTYDDAGRVLTKTVGGEATSYTYDAAGRQMCLALPGATCPDGSGNGGSGSYTWMTYYPSGLVHTRRAADGGVTTYTYDTAGRVLTVTDPTSAVTTNHYDPTTGLLTSVDKPGEIVNGVQQYVTTHYTYDADGNQTCTAAPGGTCPNSSGTGGVEPYTLTTYGPLARVQSITNELGQTTSYKYDVDGNKVETDNPDGSVVKAAYDAAGHLYCTTAPGAPGQNNCPKLDGTGATGRYTITRYDSFGRVSCVAQPGGDCVAKTGPITTYEYDKAGRQSSVTNVNGGITTTTYTPAGHRYQVTDPDGGVTTYAYDSSGRVQQVTDANQGVTSTAYTPQGWVQSTTDPNGLVTSYTYDAAGRPLTITAPNGVVTTRTYTLRGELKTQQVGTDGTVTYTYNGDGTVQTVTDALGNTTSYSYDARGNRVSRTNAAGTTQQWTYDNANELVTQADQLNRATTTTYYDDTTNGHKTVASDPSGRTTTTVYNPDGTVASTAATDSAGSVNYGYSYDNLGHLTSVSDGTNSWGYVYSAANELTSATVPSGATTTWSYDAAGRRTTMTYPDGTTVTYGYDPGGRLNSLDVTPNGATSKLLAASYTYDGDGNLKTVTLPDGSRSYGYGTIGSSKGKLTTFTQNLPGAAFTQSLSYDGNGRVQSVTTAGTSTATPQVAAGYGFSLALKPDGTVWSWGYDAYGQLGDGGDTSSPTPVKVGGIDHVTAVAAGYAHALALTSDGTVWAWGDDSSGELGNGSTGGSMWTPVHVKNLTGVTAIAAGYNFSVALKSNGTVWAWGRNTDSELGNNSTSSKNTPVQVSGLSGITAIGAGDFNGLAIASGGALWAWGYNGEGSLGNGTTTASKVPVQVSGLSGVVAVGGGYRYSAALKSDGTVWAWGHNGEGELGNGTTANSTTPVQVSGLTDVTTIHPGFIHQVAVKSDGTVWAWGDNSHGQLGNGTTTGATTAVQTTGLSNPAAIAAGDQHNIALLPDGTFSGWGANSNGELGTGSETADATRPTANLMHTASNVVTYSYDQAGQLTQETNSDGVSTSYTYDNLGHRRTMTTGGQVTTYAYDNAGELCWSYTASSASGNSCANTPTGATTYSYDAAGRLLTQTTDNTHKLVNTYDPAGRTQTTELVSGGSDTTQTRGYDPAGNLISTTDTGSDTYAFTYNWDVAGTLPRLMGAVENGTAVFDGIYGAGQWAAFFNGVAPAGVAVDASGNTVPTASTLGLISAAQYDAWGSTVGDPTNNLFPTVGYRGELQLGDQVDLRARTYLPALGAFSTVDPLDGVDGTTSVASLYPYAGNNPVANADPTGKQTADWNNFLTYVNQARAFVDIAPELSQSLVSNCGSNARGGSDCLFPDSPNERMSNCVAQAANAFTGKLQEQNYLAQVKEDCTGLVPLPNGLPDLAQPGWLANLVFNAVLTLVAPEAEADVALADVAAEVGSSLEEEGTWLAAGEGHPPTIEPDKPIAVIGRLQDTAVARDWPGHEVLNLPDWTIAKNDAWIQSVIDRKLPVYVGSPTTWENTWDMTNERTTVFGRELKQLTEAGYTWDGWTLIPPGGG